jgi:phage tail sheath protein FI
LTLRHAFDERPTLSEYLDAIKTLGDEPEVAMLAVCGLYDDFKNLDDPEADVPERNDIRLALLQQANDLQDRLVLLDPPNIKADETKMFVTKLRTNAQGLLRNGATYGPWLRVPNPDGGVAQPLKTIPPSGHLAGVISRLDRERGAHHTPANVSLLNAIDVETRLKPDEEEMLNGAGLNLIRCQPGRGLMVWGGRSLDPDDGARFIAHRRLIHRLVRAIRRVAEPIVFDGNTPALWLAFTRAITTVLLAAFRAGALQGERPDEAFKVECNEKTNPQSEQDLGRVICLISVAPAVPMEYITLRVALSENQEVEVFDA